MFTPAVLITGGGSWPEGPNDAASSAEIYHPDRDSACVLPDLPDVRFGHTQDGSLLCGGWPASRSWSISRSCQRWNPEMGNWENVTESLRAERAGHISWTPADGSVTYLMGGKDYITSEVIDSDNNVRVSFRLKHTTV